MIIRLSKADLHEADLLARDTVFMLEALGVSPRLEDKRQSRVEANRLGFMAEFAVCRLFDLQPPRLNIATDGGVDLWFDDISIDVKFSNTGKLIFDNAKKFQSRIAILATTCDDPECIKLMGWMSRKDFVKECVSHDFGYGERLVVDAVQLLPIFKLWHELQSHRFK